jgi:hypothetical protein
MPQTNSVPSQPVLVKKVVVIKRKRSLVSFLVSTILVLVLLLIVGAFLAFSAWMYTYKALTNEKVVGELHVSGKTIKDGVPTYTVRYVPLDQESVLPFVGSSNDADKEVRADMQGDQVFVDADFIRWENWATLVGVSPVYKVYRIKSDYNDINERNKFRSSAFDMNGGPDEFVEGFATEESKTFDWLVQSVFISSAGINITNESQIFNVIVTKDAVVLEAKK